MSTKFGEKEILEITKQVLKNREKETIIIKVSRENCYSNSILLMLHNSKCQKVPAYCLSEIIKKLSEEQKKFFPNGLVSVSWKSYGAAILIDLY